MAALLALATFGSLLVSGLSAAYAADLNAMLPANIREAGVLTAAAIPSYPPFVFVDSKGEPTGIDPDLFRAVVSHVPFVDVMNTMLDATLPLTVPEYEEWGNPNESAYFLYMLSYSPYDNLKAGSYPAMLVKTSLHDSQVMYWEPAKYVAKLRTLKTDSNPLLLLTNMQAGHGGASGRYDYLKEIAFDYAFLLRELGIVP